MNSDPIDNLPFSATDWERLRVRFRSSLMVDTELFKLAQNIDANWPIRGKDETPEKYISFTLEELAMMPEFFGKTDRLPLLYNILNETLAFDDPFGEMADYVDSSSKKDDSAMKTLARLEVPAQFPIKLANFSDETRQFCRNEAIEDIQSLVRFSQNMAQSIVVGGEFRTFLNSLTHLDTQALRRFIPIREGKKGLFLAESLGLLAQNCSASEAKTLLTTFKLPSKKQEWELAKPLKGSDADTLFKALKEMVVSRLDYFPDQAQQLRHAHASGSDELVRYFAYLNDPDLESLCQGLTFLTLGELKESKKSGLFGRLFNR